MSKRKKDLPMSDLDQKNKIEDPRTWAKTKISFLSRLSAKDKRMIAR